MVKSFNMELPLAKYERRPAYKVLGVLSLALLIADLACAKTEREIFESLAQDGRSISAHWREGNELIYDCDLKAFVCVDQYGKAQCLQQASKAKAYPEVYQSCRSIMSYPTLKKCTQQQVAMIDKAIESVALGCL